MKKEEKIRMLLHPERYTDEQIEKMLNETPVAEPDVDEAWKHFKKGHHQYRQPEQEGNPQHHRVLRRPCGLLQ